MTQNNHLNQMFFQANDPDFNYDMQDVNDQENSYTLPRLRPENWQNLNDYDESQLISVCSHESNLEKNQMQDEYLEKLGKGYDQYCQTKKHNEKPLTKLQQHTVFSENQSDSKKSKKIKKKLKQINKSTRGRKLLTRTANNIKVEEQTEKNQNRTIINSEMEEEQERIGMNPENKNNLKNISKKVCRYMQSFEFKSNSDLFSKLREQFQKNRDKNKIQEDRYLKNLKRRMYDVVNVLRSSNIIFPEIQNKRKFIFQKNTQFQLDQVKSEHQAKKQKLKQKYQIFQMLKKKKSDLDLLRKRNIKLQQQKKVQLSQKIHFPILFYNLMPNEKCEVSPTEVRITKSSTRRKKKQKQKQKQKQNKKQAHYNLYSQLDTLKWLQLKQDTQKQTKVLSPMKMTVQAHKKEMPGLRWSQLSNIEKIKRGQQSKYD